jgi:hypothetical protein
MEAEADAGATVSPRKRRGWRLEFACGSRARMESVVYRVRRVPTDVTAIGSPCGFIHSTRRDDTIVVDVYRTG